MRVINIYNICNTCTFFALRSYCTSNVSYCSNFCNPLISSTILTLYIASHHKGFMSSFIVPIDRNYVLIFACVNDRSTIKMPIFKSHNTTRSRVYSTFNTASICQIRYALRTFTALFALRSYNTCKRQRSNIIGFNSIFATFDLYISNKENITRHKLIKTPSKHNILAKFDRFILLYSIHIYFPIEVSSTCSSTCNFAKILRNAAFYNRTNFTIRANSKVIRVK